MSIDPVQSAVVFAPGSERPDSAPARAKPSQPPVEKAQPFVSPAPPLPEARSLQVSASFGDGHLVIYRILDKETGQLLEQIPPEQFLEAARKTEESSVRAPDPKLNLKF